MSKFSQEIEVSGHLIDSLILTKIFDKIMDLKGEFQVEEINIGKKKKDQSFARLQIIAKNQKHLDEILKQFIVKVLFQSSKRDCFEKISKKLCNA